MPNDEASTEAETGRCAWAGNELAIAYHDEEWGVPVHDDRMLFEFLILEGAQAGLSWITILKKRENYRKAFVGFRAEKIARYGMRDVKRLLGDAGIVRNRLKIAAAITNAKAFIALRGELKSFDDYMWSFVGSTICYALMQATGMVNDHLVTCPRHAALGGVGRRS